MKGKKGQTVFAGIMIAIMVFITAVILIQPLKDVSIWARNSDNLDCDNTSISTGQKGACILADFYLFYFFGMVMAAGGAYLSGRYLFGLIRGE